MKRPCIQFSSNRRRCLYRCCQLTLTLPLGCLVTKDVFTECGDAAEEGAEDDPENVDSEELLCRPLKGDDCCPWVKCEGTSSFMASIMWQSPSLSGRSKVSVSKDGSPSVPRTAVRVFNQPDGTRFLSFGSTISKSGHLVLDFRD